MPIILDPIVTQPVGVLAKEVMLHLPMAPIFEVEYRTAQVVRDFLRETRAWRQRDTTLLTTVAGQRIYPADLDPGMELLEIVACWNGEDEVATQQPGQEEDYRPGHRAREWVIGIEPVNNMRLSPAPDVSGIVLTGTVAFATTEDATTLPDFIYQRWRTEIGWGVIANMAEQKDKPWSDPARATYYQGKFKQACCDATLLYGIRKRHPRRVTPLGI